MGRDERAKNDEMKYRRQDEWSNAGKHKYKEKIKKQDQETLDKRSFTNLRHLTLILLLVKDRQKVIPAVEFVAVDDDLAQRCGPRNLRGERNGEL